MSIVFACLRGAEDSQRGGSPGEEGQRGGPPSDSLPKAVHAVVMATQAQFERIARSMPESESGSHFGEADFRVQNKIFAGMARAGERAWLKIASKRQVELIATRADVFEAATGAWGRSGWTYVLLPHIAVPELRRLVEDSWRSIAPRTVASAPVTTAANSKLARRSTPSRAMATARASAKSARRSAPGRGATATARASGKPGPQSTPVKVAATARAKANSTAKGANARTAKAAKRPQTD